MKRIQELDGKLSALFQDFQSIATEIELQDICALSDAKTIAKQNYAGIYKIDINTTGPHSDLKSWVSAFQLEWEHPDFKVKFTPNIKKKRIKCHSTLETWMPLYLGKSKNVAARVWEHINLGIEKTTSALKLNARPTMANCQFRLSTVELNVNNYDLIAPELEKALRNRFNPIVGKQ